MFVPNTKPARTADQFPENGTVKDCEITVVVSFVYVWRSSAPTILFHQYNGCPISDGRIFEIFLHEES